RPLRERERRRGRGQQRDAERRRRQSCHAGQFYAPGAAPPPRPPLRRPFGGEAADEQLPRRPREEGGDEEADAILEDQVRLRRPDDLEHVEDEDDAEGDPERALRNRDRELRAEEDARDRA